MRPLPTPAGEGRRYRHASSTSSIVTSSTSSSPSSSVSP
jgi:hypothetical protein